MTTTLITGASRGIGLEYVRQLLAAGQSVIAACRTPTEAHDLRRLVERYGAAKLRLEALDVDSAESIDALAARLQGAPIDILINNAGLYGPPGAPSWPDGARAQSLEGMDYAFWELLHRVNVIGPFRTTAALLPNLLAGERKLAVMMSSDLGSIANNRQGASHAYRSSKAALNMITRGLSIDLKDRGVTVVSMAPGWTKTDLGGDGAPWAVDDSVRAQLQVLSRLGPADSGQFINLNGQIVPW